MLGVVCQHFGEPSRIAYLKLHMIVSLKNGVIAGGIGFHHCLTVFEMIFYAAKLEIDMLLQFFGKGRKGFILQAVRNLPPQICIGQIFPCGDKIRLYEVIVTPQDFFNVPPFDQYRLLMARYKSGVIIWCVTELI